MMLLQLFQLFPLCSPPPGTPIPPVIPNLSACPWAMHISSLASPCPILFFFKILFIYFREGNGGKKRGRETSMCGCL